MGIAGIKEILFLFFIFISINQEVHTASYNHFFCQKEEAFKDWLIVKDSILILKLIDNNYVGSILFRHGPLSQGRKTISYKMGRYESKILIPFTTKDDFVEAKVTFPISCIKNDFITLTLVGMNFDGFSIPDHYCPVIS